MFPPFLGCFQCHPFLCREDGQHGQLVPTMPSKMCTYPQNINSYSIGPVSGFNSNLPLFSVGSVRARSVFSVKSAEFGSVANNDVTF